MAKILLTGANGFLGRAIQSKWMRPDHIVTLGRGTDSNIICDLAQQVPVIPPVEMVVHAAGRAHIVPRTDAEKESFAKVNVQGTKNLLKGLGTADSLKKFVFISSVSVYGATEGVLLPETTPLRATDPYGLSKIAAEELVVKWCQDNGISYYILRLPLIAGTNPPGNLGAMVRGIQSGRYFSIGKAQAKKSMILAQDIAFLLSDLNGPSGVYNLTDGYHPCFAELENKVASHFKKKQPFALPLAVAKVLGYTGDLIGARFPVNSTKLKKITSTLTFEDAKARNLIGWKPGEVLQDWQID